MKATSDCIEYWNGWFRQVKKGEYLNQRGIIVNELPSNIIWDGRLGRSVSK